VFLVQTFLLVAMVTAWPQRAEACAAVTVPPPTVLASGVWEITYTINQCGAVYTPLTRYTVEFQVRYTPPNGVMSVLISNPTVSGEVGSVVGLGERTIQWDPRTDNVPANSRIDPVLVIRAPHNYVRGGAFSVANYLVDDNVPMVSIGPSASYGRFLTNYVAIEGEIGIGVMDSEVSARRHSASLKQDVIMGNVRTRMWTWKRLSFDAVGGLGATNQWESSDLGPERRAWEFSASGGVDGNLAITSRLSLTIGGRAFWINRDPSTLPLSSVAVHIPAWIQFRF
jgi:hypothetical protein